MAGLTSEQRFELLQTLRTDSGQAEMGGRIEDNFYPIAEHLRAFEPDVVLIVIKSIPFCIEFPASLKKKMQNR